MIIQTGMRTDIPAFYSKWFLNRLKEGYVLVRNPYDPLSVTRYRLNPDVVDLIAFCTKNPAPMLSQMDALKDYGQYWFVTITPYGRDVEPNVPDKEQVLEDFMRLSEIVGVDSMGWRYDPVLITDRYPPEKHVEVFEHMAKLFPDIRRTVSFPSSTCTKRSGEISRKCGRFEKRIALPSARFLPRSAEAAA